MESYIIYFFLFLFYGIVPVVITSDKYFTDIESVVRDLIAENKDMKIRIEKLELGKAYDHLEIEKLKNRVMALEVIAFGNSDDNPKSYKHDREHTSIKDGNTSHMGDEATSASNRDKFFPDSNVALKQHRIISLNRSPLSGQLSKRAAGTEVAFHVYLSGNRCYSNHEIFKFDTEMVDVGGGFNIHDGIFDAPATGVYVFSWTVTAMHDTYFGAELVVNGAVAGVVMTDADISGSVHGTHPSTGLVLANVNANDHVFIRFVKGENCGVQSNAGVRTSFSGWLLI